MNVPLDPPGGAPPSIDDRLGLDHERLDSLLEQCGRAVGARTGEASRLLDTFATALLAHMEWEEKHLFPAVKARSSARSQRSIESLEIDHERIRQTLSEARSGIDGSDWTGAAQALSNAAVFLEGHNYDEEHGVYVEADQLLGPDARRLLLEAFERAREAAKG